MAIWKTDKLRNLPIEFVDGDRSSKYPKRSEFVSEGIPFLNAESINEGYLNLSKANFLTEEKFSSIKKGRLQGGDLILTTRGNGVGKAAYFSGKPSTGLINAQLLIIRPEQKHIFPRFLYYSFINPYFQGTLKNFVSGSAQPQLPIQSLREVELSYPPLPIQCKITAILSAYDDLIENNTRRIEILEEMARSLYREWFVNFRFPGHEQVKMVDSELGLIPEGWEFGRLDDALILQRGFDLPTKQRKEGNVPIYASTGITGTHNEAKVKAPGVVTGRSGSLGTVIYVDEDFWPLNTTLWVKEFRRVTPLYAFYLLSNLKLDQYNSGAAVPTLNRNDIHGLLVVLPHQRILEQFNQFVEPLLVLKKNLIKRNDNLRQTRDLLLPKLISGEIDLENLEINTGEIAA
jgi:type I restriction enzyme S subunit